MKYILLIHSHVFINCNDDEVLLYNSLNGKILYSNMKEFVKTISNIKTIGTPDYIIKDLEIIPNSIVNDIVNMHMGRLLQIDDICPVQFSPSVNINGVSIEMYTQKPIFSVQDLYEKELLEKDYCQQMGKNVLDYLTTLTIYFSCDSRLNPKYKYASRQYLFPELGDNHIDIDRLEAFLEKYTFQLEQVNIVVGDINQEIFLDLKKMIEKIIKQNCAIAVYTGAYNISQMRELIGHIDLLCLWVLSDYNGVLLNEEKIRYLGLVTEDSEMNFNDEITVFPCKTEGNKDFCLSVSSYSIEDMLNMDFPKNEIISSQYLNANFFGELSILSSGNIYSCLQHPPIGNIDVDDLREVLYSEFLTYKNWFMVRKNLSVCKSCVFNFLCPPISNYELSIGEIFCNKNSKINI